LGPNWGQTGDATARNASHGPAEEIPICDKYTGPVVGWQQSPPSFYIPGDQSIFLFAIASPLLISTAADHAAGRLVLDLAVG